MSQYLINKVAILGILLTFSLNLLSAAKSSSELSSELKFDQETKVKDEELQKVLAETKKMLLGHVMAVNFTIPFLKEVAPGINCGQIRAAWDFLVYYDRNGENINKLKILLKKGIKINEAGANNKKPIALAIEHVNYELFAFLLNNGAVLLSKDEQLLNCFIENTSNSDDNESLGELSKMKLLYYSTLGTL